MQDLSGRLLDREDRFVERKPARAGNSDFKRTIVAFANSVPPNRVGVMFIGVGDNGEIQGVPNTDDLQRSIRKLAETECFPPIYVDTEVLTSEGKQVVAVSVGPSAARPHFAGHAYVRRGSESVRASDKAFEELLIRREGLRDYLFEWINKACTLTSIGKQPGMAAPMGQNHADHGEYIVVEVTLHFVVLRSTRDHRTVTEPIRWLTLAWDDRQARPWLVARMP